MPTLEEKLSGYEDFELAFMYRYQAGTYLPESQKRIKEYLLSRGLTEVKIESLIKEKSSEPHSDERQCPRCRSKKIRSDRVEITDSTSDVEAIDGMAGISSYRNENRCNVCGLFLNEPLRTNKSTFWEMIFFGWR